MDLFSSLAVALAALLLAAAVLWWSLRRRAALRSALEARGWQLQRDGQSAIVVPIIGDWTMTMTRSYAAQMSPPSSRIVTSVWAASTPAVHDAALIAGPAPPAALRALAADLIGSASPTMTSWLGIDRVTAGLPLQAVDSADERLLVFATPGYGSPGTLAGVADAVSAWCRVHTDEREQPAVSINDAGVSVRVRTDVLKTVELLDDFVALGTRCRAAIGSSQA